MKSAWWLLALLCGTGAVAPAQQPLAFTHVTVVEVRSGQLLRDQTVIVEGNRIREVAHSGAVRIPSGALVVDAIGKFLIPGLWDMHTHVLETSHDSSSEELLGLNDRERAFRLLIANGVTGISDMYTRLPLSTVALIRQQTAKGTLLGPRIVATGLLVDGDPPMFPGSIVVRSAQEAREAVRRLKRGDADFVKVYSRLSRDAYFGIAEGSIVVSIPFVGHVPESITPQEASEAGQASIEHIYRFDETCYPDAAEDHKRYQELGSDSGLSPAEKQKRRDALKGAWLAKINTAYCAPVFQHLAEKRTWVVPTLVDNRANAHFDDDDFKRDPRLKYLWREEKTWDAKHYPFLLEYAEIRRDHRLRQFEIELNMVRALHGAGVPLLAGTDSGSPYVYPGFNLHNELQLFVTCGLTPVEALQTATLNPAIFLGRTADLGTIEAGKLADLVLLDANPLDDIANTQKIRAAVVNGRYVDRAALDALLAEVVAGDRRSK
jgi:imidazolonepropionase-like amidohydrolase